jgi:hypothetical protein
MAIHLVLVQTDILSLDIYAYNETASRAAASQAELPGKPLELA